MRHSFIHFLLLCLFLLPAAAKAGEPVGAVKEVTGAATLLHAGEADKHAVTPDAALFMKDVIEAQEGAHLKLTFADGTAFTLSGRGKFTVDEYVYDPKAPDKNKSVFSLLGAAFSYTSGLIGKSGEAKSSINLDFGSIGIRGTEILSAFAGGGNWIYLDSGKITIDNDGGQVIVSAGEGTSVTSRTQAPDAPYAWGADEIAWLRRVIDDPSARVSGAMASGKESLPPGRARAPSQMAAAEAPSRALERLGKDSAGLADEKTAKKAAEQSANVMAAAPAAPAAQMPASPAEADAAAGGAEAGAKAPASPPPAAIAAVPAQMPADAERAPAAVGKAEAKAKAQAERAAPQDVISLKNLSAATLGTRVTQDGAGIVRIDTQTATTINLASADISAQHLEDTTLMFRASMKAKGLTGKAFLEMWVRFPGEKGGVYFSRGLDNPLTKNEDWKEFQTPFFLKKGQVPDKVILNIVIHGHGTVWIRDVRLQK